jgi:hypothetical protein
MSAMPKKDWETFAVDNMPFIIIPNLQNILLKEYFSKRNSWYEIIYKLRSSWHFLTDSGDCLKIAGIPPEWLILSRLIAGTLLVSTGMQFP